VATSELSVVLQALRNLGANPITAAEWAAPSGSRLATIADTYFDDVRDATLIAHPWNCAVTRAPLVAEREPLGTLTPTAITGDDITFTASLTGTFFVAGASDVGKVLDADAGGQATIDAQSSTNPAATLTPAAGALVQGSTGIVFTAGSSVFVAGDVGKVITNDLGMGIATITAQGGTTATCTINEAFPSITAIASGDWTLTSTTVVTADITEDFLSTAAIATGAWSITNATPDSDFTFSLTLPSDFLRLWRTEDRERYQHEGEFLVADVASLECRYIARITNASRWSPLFTRAFVHHLTAILAEPVTGQAGKFDRFWNLYASVLKQARTVDGLEGSTEQLIAHDLIDVRYGTGGRGWDTTRTPL
jgi:hypothetical protein